MASMIWGYVEVGYGPYRTEKGLKSPDAISVLQSAAVSVASGRIRHAYETINKKISWCGPAFFTKFLYFIGLGVKINPLPVILDTQVAGALEKLGKDENWDFNVFTNVSRKRKKKNEIGSVKPYAEGYIRYVDTLHEWTKELGCPRADYIECFLFNLNQGRLDSWRP
ncbi:MAG: hypothetical protein BZY88_13030 [SAR202 cluster bacterium Io17-Chloro-G9]|nr:MAG: hypothetical protein BZY88_13030 [SAR202 cluster bacterium Io17-Chloro-G9]